MHNKGLKTISITIMKTYLNFYLASLKVFTEKKVQHVQAFLPYGARKPEK